MRSIRTRIRLPELKVHYRRDGLADMFLKRQLTAILQATIAPIRERRADLARHLDFIVDILRDGTTRSRHVTERTTQEVAGLVSPLTELSCAAQRLLSGRSGPHQRA
jgi:hypothetical protein